ncbi:MAG: outer membrane lipoprotein-sorting protein [Pirellulales bacterium]|nr:outer membrane lipoprotein-sorting protein [Pirellulales bacterium]
MLPCLSLWLGLVSLAAAEVADIEREAVEYRRAIRSGEVIVRRDDPNGRAAELHIWWDGDSFRQDVSSGNGYRVVDVWHQGQYLHFSDEPSDNGNKLVATVADANDRGAVGSKQPSDPRRIGMAAVDFLNLVHYPLDEVLTNPARKNTTVRQDQLAGQECTLVTITRVNGGIIRVWIAPERDFSVLRMDCEISDGRGTKSFDTVDVEVALHEPSGLWFPVHSHCRNGVNDRIDCDEDCTIQVISLNQPIPPEVFTFAGIGVPVGWPVSDHTRPDIDRQLAWDGQAVVTVERAADTARAATRTNVIYLAGALVLAAVALVLLWRFFSLRRANG